MPLSDAFIEGLERLARARLRAWVELGLPLEGSWGRAARTREVEGAPGRHEPVGPYRPCWALRCQRCRQVGWGILAEESLDDPALTVLTAIRAMERTAFEALVERSCSHCDLARQGEPEGFESLVLLLTLEQPR